MGMKRNRRVCIGIFLAVSMAFSAAAAADEAEEQKDFHKFNESLGFQYGTIFGTGLSYQRWDSRQGFQAVFGAWYNPISTDVILDYAVGAEYQYSVYGEDFAKWLSGQLYLFAGLTHQGYINVESTYDEETYETTYTQGPFGYVFGGGFGIGIEVILFEHFSIPFEIGYGIYWDGSKETLAEQFLVDLAFQVGFRYRY